jgi:hypothetical protein
MYVRECLCVCICICVCVCFFFSPQKNDEKLESIATEEIRAPEHIYLQERVADSLVCKRVCDISIAKTTSAPSGANVASLGGSFGDDTSSIAKAEASSASPAASTSTAPPSDAFHSHSPLISGSLEFTSFLEQGLARLV